MKIFYDIKTKIFQVIGTPGSGGDGDRQAAARLAGQHYLSSPPDMRSGGRRGQPRSELDEDSDLTTQYSEGLADNELDSEISSLFGAGDVRGDPRLQNLHLMSPLEYAAMLKQHTSPPGILGQDITPDSGVVVDSRLHSRVSLFHWLAGINDELQ